MNDVDHRGWPVPSFPWVMKQVWNDLLFTHWPIDVDVMRRLVPQALPLDTFDGKAWIGVVPFWMSGVRARGVPPLPGLSTFPELNVRTYVTLDGKPGVYFFSFDAANRPAVMVTRLYGLNYYRARMTVQHTGDWIDYSSQRTHRGAPRASLRMRYRPTGPELPVVAGSLDRWLTERYCLYVVGRNGQPQRLEINHRPWPLQPAEAETEANTMTTQLELPLPDVAPLLHFAKRLEVRIWPKVRA